MKHSAKAAARRARERSQQERRRAGRRRAGSASPDQASLDQASAGRASTAETGRDKPSVGRASTAETGRDQPSLDQAGSLSAGPDRTRAVRHGARRTRALRATASRVGTTAAGRADHQRMAQLPYAVVLAGTAAGLVLMQVAKDAVRSGTLVIAGALLAGSLTRLVLPEGRAGLLGSRRRLVDVALLTALGVGLLTAGLIVKVPG